MNNSKDPRIRESGTRGILVLHWRSDYPWNINDVVIKCKSNLLMINCVACVGPQILTSQCL